MHPITNMGEKCSILFRHLTIENSFKQCELLVCKGCKCIDIICLWSYLRYMSISRTHLLFYSP